MKVVLRGIQVWHNNRYLKAGFLYHKVFSNSTENDDFIFFKDIITLISLFQKQKQKQSISILYSLYYIPHLTCTDKNKYCRPKNIGPLNI